MKKVCVDKVRLLKTLKENRAVHIEEYKDVYEAYRLQKIIQLESVLDRAKACMEFNLHFDGGEPVGHTDTFDAAIEMVQWSEEQVIELDQEDFRRYVLNDWDWVGRFKMHQTMYLGKK